MDTGERFQKIRRILFFILYLNWGVAAAKLSYAWMTRSASMKADGFHSFSDGASNLPGLIGIWIASRQIDRSHPYGHKKFETLTSVIISGLLFLVCFNVVREGVLRFLHPVVPEVNVKSFLVMGVTLAINIGVMIYGSRRGKPWEVISSSPMPYIPVLIFSPRLLSLSRSLALSWGIPFLIPWPL